MGIDEARRILRRRLQQRSEHFLGVLRRGVFDRPGSPYLPLFELAGCEFEDVEATVRSEGVEAALEAVHDAGVYVTFEEFKGRRPIVREGLHLPVSAGDFDNPCVRPSFFARSSGSTGRPTRTPVDLEHVMAETPLKVLLYDAFGVLGVPTALWRGIPPAVAGLKECLRSVAMRQPVERWFTPVTARDLRLPVRTRLATGVLFHGARLLGVRLPRPEPLPLDNPGPLVQWTRQALAAEGACLIRSFVSMAVRVAVCAGEMGVDLRGATFLGGGEPPTAAKVRAITSSGARYVPNYAATEVGTMGAACADPATHDDVHLLSDALALIQRPLEVPEWRRTAPAFYVTTLLPTAPKLLINVEMDDYGVVEQRRCGCPLGELGYTTHLRGIRSYRKLTGEGVTLVGEEAVRVLQEVLPSRFGGGPLDYQLLEEEGEDGLTRLSLIVSPRVDLPDEQDVIDVFARGLGEGGHPAKFAAAFWRQAGALRVRRMEPVWSAGGKFMPLCVAERLSRSGAQDAQTDGLQ
jgi:hypothetical protein